MLEGTSKRAVISVVGMGGLGKTTLAKKVNDSEGLHHTLIARLGSQYLNPTEGGATEDHDKANCNEKAAACIRWNREYGRVAADYEAERVLSEKRHIVVLDDVWSIDFWGYIRMLVLIMTKAVESLSRLEVAIIRDHEIEKRKVIALCSALEKMTCLRSLSVFSIHGMNFWIWNQFLIPFLSFNVSTYMAHNGVAKLDSQANEFVKLDLFCSRLGEGAMQDLDALPNLLRLRIYKGYKEQLHFRRDCFQKLKVLHLRSLTPLNVLIIDQGSLPLLEELIIGPCPNLKEVPSASSF
ncbi:hypothetical protein GH714_010014 [Hevea brasiliensis]|uniref:NB-ARC domain-containing protein n=1 Tax=Hevea brasiliensis TaxID=3981 RepID=A0A6A6KEV4_HEVBR|nr:hypothetical protein GH714_010014 [Hevea brasiliensis]